MSQITTAEAAYLRELSADIAANGGVEDGQTIEQAMRAAHARRQALAQEMRDGKTQRAKIARRALAAKIYHSLRFKDALDDIAVTA